MRPVRRLAHALFVSPDSMRNRAPGEELRSSALVLVDHGRRLRKPVWSRARTRRRIGRRWPASPSCFALNPTMSRRLLPRRTLQAPGRRYAPGAGANYGRRSVLAADVLAPLWPYRCERCSVGRISRSSSASTARRGLRTRWLSVSCSQCGAARGLVVVCVYLCRPLDSIESGEQARTTAARAGALLGGRCGWESCAVPALSVERVCSLPPPPSGPSRSWSARRDGGASADAW